MAGIGVALAAAATLFLVQPVHAKEARGDRVYEITVTNLTRGQTFTPILAATHSKSVKLFRVGQMASGPLEILAEGGATDPLAEALRALGASHVGDVQTAPGLLGPGETRTLTVQAGRQWRLSVAAMLIPTNDTFFAIDGVRLPWRGTRSVNAPAYDAGTEANDQNCANMPGPRCGGEGVSEPADGDEGFVGVGNGFHDIGDFDEEKNEILGPLVYDWRNPVARVTVRRVN